MGVVVRRSGCQIEGLHGGVAYRALWVNGDWVCLSGRHDLVKVMGTVGVVAVMGSGEA